MRIQLRLGLVAAVCLFAIATVLPADAQHRHGSGSAVRSGSGAAPRPSQAPHPSAASRPSQGQHPSAGPRPSQGHGSGAAPRPAGGHGYGPGPRYGYGYRPYPGYGSRYYFGFGAYYGPYYFNPWFYSPYWYYPPYGYGYWNDYGSGGASLKVQVEPKTAEVYVDGHLAGIVDQFDGMFQSLSVEPGGHEITVYQDGYRGLRQELYLSAGSTYRIKGALEKLAAGDPSEPRPTVAPELPAQQAPASPQYRGFPPPDVRAFPPEAPSFPPQGPPADRQAPDPYPPVAGDAKFGQVAIRVQPGDAEVQIDGEAWRSPAGADRLVVHLSAGTHRVEIRKDGYDPFVTAVEIRRGETTVLNVSLARF
jgi:hypothetical protein